MVFESKHSIYDALSKYYPCIFCAKKNIPIDIRKETKKCSGCGYAHYCCGEHQKADWKNHKLFCKSMTPDLLSALKRYMLEAYLFTDGKYWYSIPVGASKELQELYFISKKIEKLAHMAAEKGKVFKYKTPFCITPEMLKLIKTTELAANLNQRFSYSLQSDYACFHEQIYGLNHPYQIRIIIDFLKNKNITNIIDPLARTGITVDMFKTFSNNYFNMRMSDLKPEHESVFKSDALDAITYKDFDSDKTVVIVSWPDPGGRDPPGSDEVLLGGLGDGLSVALIPFLHEIGVKYLLVMYEDYKVDESNIMECAICPTGLKILNKLYKKTKIPGVDTFIIMKEKTQNTYGGYLDKLINAMISKGVGQSTYFYERI